MSKYSQLVTPEEAKAKTPSGSMEKDHTATGLWADGLAGTS
jgi:hypothetical protein